MGRATKLKNEEIAIRESKILGSLISNTKKVKLELAKPLPDVSTDFREFEGFFIRNKESFSLKTKSKDRDKQRYEFVKHVFHLYPVPDFMFNAWETPFRGQPQHRYQFNIPQRVNSGFATKIDYRLWYICIATGGSFYKEYGKSIFTKKECHIFLNCKHNIPIKEAIVYAIAYAESGDVGKSLRISKTKVSDFNLESDYWKEVVRFFAREEIKSKEQITDIVDYIVYKQREAPDFTIVGKGHNIESISKKVEEWHQDLRRLKAIGEEKWTGIEIKNSEYLQQNSKGVVNVWKFTQITCAKDLQREGNAMRHCVLSYKNDCVKGICSIWSITLNDDRKLTMEVRRGSIVQVRGLANRNAKADEKNIIKKWAIESGLNYIC